MRYQLLFLGIFLCLLAPQMGEGMFMDGAIYACIARNLAEGWGNFWMPYFSASQHPFQGHLPLGIGMESLFFRLFGDHFYTEKLYSLAMFGASMLVLRRLWRQVAGQSDAAAFDFLPVLLWMSIPLASWSVANNMLENTVLFWDLLAVVLALNSLSITTPKATAWQLAAGAAVAAAVLSKGPVGAFPLSVFFWYTCVGMGISWMQMLRATAVMILGFFLPFALFWAVSSDAQRYFDGYVQVQLQGSWLNGQATVPNRWFILQRSAQELLPIGILVLMAWLYNRRKKEAIPGRSALFLMGLGLSGIVPIALSLKQSGFYAVPAFPLLAAAGALAALPLLSPLASRLVQAANLSRILAMCSMGIGISLSLYFAQGFSRDADKIGDVKRIVTAIGSHQSLALDDYVQQDWTLHAYFQRYGYIAIAQPDDASVSYRLFARQYPPTDNQGVIDIALKQYILIKK